MSDMNWLHIVIIATIVFAITIWFIARDASAARRECRAHGHLWRERDYGQECEWCYKKLYR